MRQIEIEGYSHSPIPPQVTQHNRQVGDYGLGNAHTADGSRGGQRSAAADGRNFANKFYFTNGQDRTEQLGVAFVSVRPSWDRGAEVRDHFGR